VELNQFKQSPFYSAPHFLLIGNPLGHSLSPLMHNAAAKYLHLPFRYHSLHLRADELSELPSVLHNPHLKGMNVTIPYKQAALKYMDVLDERVEEIGALNTIVKKENKLIGYNTDFYGFCKPLHPRKTALKKGSAVVFGTGGAARAVVFGLKQLGIDEIILVSRNPQQNQGEGWPQETSIVSYDDWPRFAEKSAIFVNATPLGMAPNTDSSPVQKSERNLLAGKICYDLIYNPLKTTFLKMTEEVNAAAISGLEMFIHQGSRSFELWMGRSFPVDIIREALMKELSNADKGHHT
jgi:shikimate dehydrogenase